MTLCVEISAPSGFDVLEPARAVRFPSTDGSVGVLPGHEPARAILAPGVVEVRMVDEERWFIATEGGLCDVSQTLVRFVTPWAAFSNDPSRLAEVVATRRGHRREIEKDARKRAQERERALHVALSKLRREVHS